jgi:hypothetical protein
MRRHWERGRTDVLGFQVKTSYGSPKMFRSKWIGCLCKGGGVVLYTHRVRDYQSNKESSNMVSPRFKMALGLQFA